MESPGHDLRVTWRVRWGLPGSSLVFHANYSGREHRRWLVLLYHAAFYNNYDYRSDADEVNDAMAMTEVPFSAVVGLYVLFSNIPFASPLHETTDRTGHNCL